VKLFESQFTSVLTPKEIKKLSNGCGPQDALIDLVPDSFLGLDLTDA